MFGIDFTFLWTAVNLLIIYLFINKYLFKKLGVFMEERSASIADGIELGKTLKLEKEQFDSELDEKLAEAYNKRKEILEESRTRASKEYDNIINEAKEEASRIIQAAREESDREYVRLRKESQQYIASLAIEAASKVIESNMDNEKNRELVNRFLSKEGAA